MLKLEAIAETFRNLEILPPPRYMNKQILCSRKYQTVYKKPPLLCMELYSQFAILMHIQYL